MVTNNSVEILQCSYVLHFCGVKNAYPLTLIKFDLAHHQKYFSKFPKIYLKTTSNLFRLASSKATRQVIIFTTTNILKLNVHYRYIIK